MTRKATRNGDIYNILRDAGVGDMLSWNADGHPGAIPPEGSVIGSAESTVSLLNGRTGTFQYVSVNTAESGTVRLVGIDINGKKSAYVRIRDNRNLNRLIHVTLR